VQSFEYGNVVAPFDEITGTSQTSRSGTNNGDFFPIARRTKRNLRLTVLPFIIGDEALQSANRDRTEFAANDAGFFALFLLQADASTDRGQKVILFDFARRSAKIPLNNQPDKIGNFDANRTPVNTSRMGTFETTLSFPYGRLSVEAEINFIEIMDTFFGWLFRHLLTGNC